MSRAAGRPRARHRVIWLFGVVGIPATLGCLACDSTPIPFPPVLVGSLDTITRIDRGNGSLTLADLNGDGRNDVALGISHRNDPQAEDGTYWFEAPAWTQHRVTPPNTPIRWSLALVAGDVNQDGRMDLVTLSFDSSNVYLATNPGVPDVTRPWPTTVIDTASRSLRDGEKVLIADLDSDGWPDVVFPRGRPRVVRALFQDRAGPMTTWHAVTLGSHLGSDAHDVAIADFNQDGKSDIVVASGDGSPGVGGIVLLTQPPARPRSETWGTRVLHRGAYNPAGLQVADLDDDGDPDIIAAESHSENGDIFWLENPGEAGGDWPRHSIGHHSAPHATLWFDADGDGSPELWVGDSGCCRIRTRSGVAIFIPGEDPTVPWERLVILPPPYLARVAFAEDLDADGDLDVVFENGAGLRTPRPILIWKNPGRLPTMQR